MLTKTQKKLQKVEKVGAAQVSTVSGTSLFNVCVHESIIGGLFYTTGV
jgi:hypothetical protein